MAQCMVVAKNHTQFGLPVMIMDRAAKAAAEPADDLGSEWFARAAHGAQLPLDLAFDLMPRGQQQAERGR